MIWTIIAQATRLVLTCSFISFLRSTCSDLKGPWVCEPKPKITQWHPVTQWSLATSRSSRSSRIAHAYAGLELPELENVKIPGAPNTKRAMHFYMKAAKQGRLLGESRIYLCPCNWIDPWDGQILLGTAFDLEGLDINSWSFFCPEVHAYLSCFIGLSLSWYSVLRTFILFWVCLTGNYYLFKWWSVFTNLVIAKNSCCVLLYVAYSAGGINWWHYWGPSQPWMPSLWCCVTQKAGPGALGGASVWLLIYSIYSFRQHFFPYCFGMPHFKF